MGYDFSKCRLCPRKCGADRTNGEGFCGGGAEIKAAKAYPHLWEEPCISGTKGSGTVFFSGCCLKCVFCQNFKISAENSGKVITVQRLGEIFLELQDKGVHNINLVSGGHYAPMIINALDDVKVRLKIPVVWNSGGYELAETLKMLEGYVDIYLPDFKYYDNALAQRYSGAADYREIAAEALSEMLRQVGRYDIGSDGIMKKGVIVRHLTLPTHRHDSVRVLEFLKERFGTEDILLSLMSQYTPFYRSCEFREISRRISTFEYNFVAEKAVEMGFNGFMQERSSAKEEYTPEFDMCGI
ncbi:MAG: radical SAM protein [Oscillospiraceae bacterium]|nr:radical SAM protein [Oscillospiraceae bacterium]